ncbi:MAG TPA: MDR family MFS transporter [Chloroflexota bacterium]|nr:MDR family MFS transporter [Chloroflexota bacterium]
MATMPVPHATQAAAPFQMRTILAPLVAIIIGVFMVVLDSTAMNVALPGLVTSFHGTLAGLQWTITGYALAQAAVIPLAGWLSDRFGAKRIFLLAIALFTIGSILCATAQSSTMLIAFRVLQGLGGGVVIPIAISYTYRLSPSERVGAIMGLMGIPILFAPALGPVVAGWLVQYASWRWIFLLNLPVGLIGLLVGLRSLPRIERQIVAGLDLPGMILGPLAFASLSYGVSQGGTSWTSATTLGGLLVGGGALVAFVLVELRAQAPLLELRVFRSLNFSLGIVAQWIGQFALFGTLFLVPLFLQKGRGYGAFDAGLTMLPYALAAAICMPLGGRLFDRIGARPLVVLGLALIGGAVAFLSRVGVTTRGTDLIVPLAMTGAGMGLMLMTLTTHLLNAAPPKLVSRVTSLTGALQQVVTSLSIASLATLLTARAATHLDATKAALAGQPAGASRLAHELGAAATTALTSAFDDTFRVMIVVAVAGALLGLTLRRPWATSMEAADDLTAAEIEEVPAMDSALAS